MSANTTNNHTKENNFYNPSESTTAGGFLQTLFYLHTEFEKTKGYLKKMSNYYVNNLFSFLGYHYKGRVEFPNILHISAESWLLGVIGELKKEEAIQRNLYNSDNFSFFNLLRLIKSVIVEENTFIENMKLLTGIYEVEEYAFTDYRIFKMFLVNIQDTKNQIYTEDFENEKFTRQNFYDTILRTLRVAFNFTLNEFNSFEDDKKSLDMINLYLELIAKSDFNHPTLEAFSNLFLEKKVKIESLPQNEEQKLFMSLECFFNFCQTSFDDLLVEISLFNSNAGSVIYRIKNLLSVKNIKRMYIKYFEILSGVLEQGYKNFKLESVLRFSKAVKTQLTQTSDSLVTLAKDKFVNTKEWINSTVDKFENLPTFNKYFTLMKNQTRQVNNFVNEGTVYSMNLINQKVLQPVRNLRINFTNYSVNFLINTYTFTKEQTENLKETLKQKLVILFTNVNDKLHIDRFFSFDLGRDYLSLSISKSLISFYPAKTIELIKFLIKKASEFNPIDMALQSVVFVKVKVQEIKNKAEAMRHYVKTKYANFLALADDECEGECKIINNLNAHLKKD